MAIPLLVLILCSIFRSCLEPPLALPDPGDSAARVVGKLSQAPEWRGVGTYLDLELQTVDAQPYRGRARLTEFLNDSEQRGLFNALDLGSGDRVEIVVKLHRPGVYQDPGGVRLPAPSGATRHLLDRHDPEPSPHHGSGPGMAHTRSNQKLDSAPGWKRHLPGGRKLPVWFSVWFWAVSTVLRPI